MGRLIRYDLLILWRSGRAAFAGKRDMLLLALAVPLTVLLAARGMNEMAAAMVHLPLPARLLLPAAAGIAVNLAVARRLRQLREESVVARHALRPAPAWCHAAFCNLVPIAAVEAIALLSAPGDAGQAASFGLCYLAGAGIAQAQTQLLARLRQWSDRAREGRSERSVELSGATRWERVAQLLTARAGLLGPSLRRNLLLLAVLGLGIGAAHRGLTEHMAAQAAAVVAGMVTLLLLGLLLRARPALLRYLVYMGLNPAAPAILIPTAMAAALLAGLLCIGLVDDPDPWGPLSGAAVVLLGFVVIAAVRALHYATKPRQRAEIALQVDLVAALLVGSLAFPLLLPAVAAHLWLLAGRVRAMRHLLA